ncbi:MAG: tyrosine-type recombinase/integrase [Stellaceae bacterium]
MAAASRKVVLTDRGIRALKPAPTGKRVVLWDAVMPGLAVRVTDRGTRSFVVVRRRPGARNPDWLVLGNYHPSELPLQQARKKAAEVLRGLAEGKKPVEAEAEQTRAVARRRRHTVAEATEAFIEDERTKGLRSASETESILRRQFLGQNWERDGSVKRWKDGPEPIWRATPIAEIARRDIISRLDEIKRIGGKHAARHALGAVRKFFGWCAEGERFGIEVSPCAGIRDKTLGIAGRDLQRRRVLTDAELRDVWQAAAKLGPAGAAAAGYPFGMLVQLLMLTGQRLSDLAQARWSEINLDGAVLMVPPERFKTGVAHEVMLAPMAVEILRAVPRFAGLFVFSTTAGRRPISGMSKMKDRLDATIAAGQGGEAIPPWVLHDLRRTVRTRLVSDLGVEAFIAERVIGHALPGLHAVYDQGSHRPQKRAALEQWAQHLRSIVEPMQCVERATP